MADGGASNCYWLLNVCISNELNGRLCIDSAREWLCGSKRRRKRRKKRREFLSKPGRRWKTMACYNHVDKLIAFSETETGRQG
jgi:hypothetical protein